MNRVYNKEAIIMACVVHLLKKKNMDMALLYLLSTLLIDNQLSTILRVSVYFEQLSVSIRNQGLISRKLDSFGPYFINALVILKQSNIIEISDGRLQLTNSSFPEGCLKSKRLERIIKNSEHLLNICSGLSTKELYNNLNIQL